MEACGWDDDFWEQIGLGDLLDGHHAKIGMLVGYLLIYILLIFFGDGSSGQLNMEHIRNIMIFLNWSSFLIFKNLYVNFECGN